MLLYREESFGPVCTVQRFASIEDGIRLANDSEFGLSSAVFSQNFGLAMDVAKQIDSGFATSMVQPYTMKHRCPSVALNRVVMVALAVKHPLLNLPSFAGLPYKHSHAITQFNHWVWF